MFFGQLCFSRHTRKFISMDGNLQEMELPPQPKEFTPAQRSLVQKMRRQGCSNSEIAREVGLTTAGLLYQISQGKFGRVEPRKGQHRGRNKQEPDCEKAQRLFGRTDWKNRQKQVRDSWDESEARRRQDGKMPNSSDNYHRFKRK